MQIAIDKETIKQVKDFSKNKYIYVFDDETIDELKKLRELIKKGREDMKKQISISTKELLFSNETNLLTNYSYFIATSKSGNISFISQNKKMFAIDFEKRYRK